MKSRISYDGSQIESWMVSKVSQDDIASILVFAIYLLSIIYSYLYYGWFQFQLNIAIVLLKLVFDFGTPLRKGPTSIVSCRVVSIGFLIIFTVRFLSMPMNKLILLPIVIKWIVSDNRTVNSSSFWGLIPTFYVSALSLGYAICISLTEVFSVDLLAHVWYECIIMICSVWFCTHYVVMATDALKAKVDKLEETSHQLSDALACTYSVCFDSFTWYLQQRRSSLVVYLMNSGMCNFDLIFLTSY